MHTVSAATVEFEAWVSLDDAGRSTALFRTDGYGREYRKVLVHREPIGDWGDRIGCFTIRAECRSDNPPLAAAVERELRSIIERSAMPT